MVEVIEIESVEENLGHLADKKKIEKAELRRIEISELPKKLPNFRNSNMTKDMMIAEWLETWIKSDLEKGKIDNQSLLPRKNDLATYFGISIGTVQNAIRYIEDKGIVESKQRIGTLISNMNKSSMQLRKQTSKREQAIIALKKIIIENKYKIDTALPSSRELAKIIGSASNTTRLALEHLASNGVIESKGCRGNKANWILRQYPQLTETETVSTNEISTDTLVDQVERDLKNYLNQTHKVGDKIPAHFELSQILKVSIKTVHDAMKRLIKAGIIRAKRGRYGTTLQRAPLGSPLDPKPEHSIFASAAEASVYNYEKVETHLKLLIQKNYKIGDKLPSMSDLAGELNVSSNTVRKALQRLARELIVDFSRGRYGGTFVTKMPKVEESTTFTWLSVNPEHLRAYKKELVQN
ncbi:MAG: GntR family transcriptional regulator [Candidatus Gastranaerophilaceae bacterium]|jgi:DNA-binding GntR family transcriptional regulator